jgi:hypothetical protein
LRQILHIFSKDARRFWPEILVSLVILAAFVRVYPVNWVPQDAFHSRGFLQYASQLQILANVLTGLVPASWWLLIARVIHAEALVGERQFWVTRPYEWPKLLAAKGLFLAVFLYAPFVAAQWGLLGEGGFRPWEYVPGILFNLLLLTGILVLPLVALAAVTSTLVRMTLTLLGIAAGLGVIVYLASLSETSGVSAPYGDRYSVPATLVIGGSAIVLMYARRRVWFARLMLLSLPGIIGVVAAYVPNGAMVETAYPLATGMAAVADVPIQFALHEGQENQTAVTEDSQTGRFEVRIPLEATGVSAGYVVMVDDVMAVAEDGHEVVRELPWRAVYSHYYLHGDWLTSVDLKMKRAEYEALKGRVLTLKLGLALTEARTEAVTRIALPAHDFEVPGFGNCAGAPRMSALMTNLGCWTAMHGPPLTFVKANLGSTPCGEVAHGVEDNGTTPETNAGPDREGLHATAWVGSLENDPAEFGMTSVWSTNVSLSEGGDYGAKYLCPGTMVSFTRFGLVRRLRTVVAIPNFRIPEVTKGVGE